MKEKTASTPSATIATHFEQLSWRLLPSETAHATRRALLDALGVSLAATGLAPEVQPFRELALADGGRRQSRLLGSRRRVPASAAAFANAACAHALDFGDTYDEGPAHPNAALVPALLALADAHPEIDGGAFLSAMAAGSDLACRMSLAPARPYEEGGWYPPPLFGTIAAAAGCARLLGLPASAIVQAMGLAMCQASFPAEIKYDGQTQLRAVREAFGARAAVTSAQLAMNGVRGFDAPLEGKGGFFAIYGGGLREEPLLGQLGQRFRGDEVSFKPWPSCRGTHAYIEAALLLRKQVDLRDIAAIEAGIGPVQKMLCYPAGRKAHPETSIEAKFSIPYTIAAALAHGEVGLDSFLPTARTDHDTLAMAALVRPVEVEGWGREQAASGWLTLVMQDGRRLHADIAQAAGHPSRPVSDDALVAKFLLCASRAHRPIPAGPAEAMARRILSLGPDVSASSILQR